MRTIDVLGSDRECLIELWERSRREYDAANALLLTGDSRQGRSVALHIFRGWHALVSMFACKSGLPEPDFDAFTLDSGSAILAPIGARSLSDWESSFGAIRDTALQVPWYAGGPEPGDRLLRRQASLLGRCVKAHRPGVAEVQPGGRGWRVTWRQLLIFLAVAILAVAGFDLGKRLWVGLKQHADAGDFSPDIPQDVSVSLEQLSDMKPRGYAWDDPGTVRFMNRVVVSLEGFEHSQILSISVDGNDAYSVQFMAGDETVGGLKIEPSWIGGLDVYTLTIPEEAISLGFDSIVIEADGGDGAYALGHLLLDPIGDEDSMAVEGPG